MAFAFQVQVAYCNNTKTRQVYLERTLNYNEFMIQLVEKITSLRFAEFQVAYENDEGTWITMSDNQVDITDMYRCATPVNNAEYRRIKIRIMEGCSPVIRETTDCDRFGKERCYSNPKKLKFDSDGVTTCSQHLQQPVESDDDDPYVTPLELDIKAKKEELREMEAEMKIIELDIARENEKYVSNVVEDSTKKRCSKCHLREGHSRKNCPYTECKSASVCGDISHPAHIDEKKELNILGKQRDDLNRDIKKKQIELKQKTELCETLMSSFEKKIEVALINSNRELYMVNTAAGPQPKRYLLNKHKNILRIHYGGKIPDNLEEAKKSFPKIIHRYTNKMHLGPTSDSRAKSRDINRRRLLETNPVRPITFPSTASTHTEEVAATQSGQAVDTISVVTGKQNPMYPTSRKEEAEQIQRAVALSSTQRNSPFEASHHVSSPSPTVTVNRPSSQHHGQMTDHSNYYYQSGMSPYGYPTMYSQLMPYYIQPPSPYDAMYGVGSFPMTSNFSIPPTPPAPPPSTSSSTQQDATTDGNSAVPITPFPSIYQPSAPPSE